MIGEDTGRDDDPRSRCSLIGSGIGFIHIINNVYIISTIPFGYPFGGWQIKPYRTK